MCNYLFRTSTLWRRISFTGDQSESTLPPAVSDFLLCWRARDPQVMPRVSIRSVSRSPHFRGPDGQGLQSCMQSCAYTTRLPRRGQKEEPWRIFTGELLVVISVAAQKYERGVEPADVAPPVVCLRHLRCSSTRVVWSL